MSRACAALARNSCTMPVASSDGASTEATRRPNAANLARERIRKLSLRRFGFAALLSTPSRPAKRIAAAFRDPSGAMTQKACVTPGRVSRRTNSSVRVGAAASSASASAGAKTFMEKSFRVRLLLRHRRVEGRQLHAGFEDSHDGWIGLQVEARIALCVEDLRHEADIGEARHITVTEPSRLAIAREGLLDPLEAEFDPMVEPGFDVLLVVPHRLCEEPEHAQIVNRVDVAGDRLGERANPRASGWIAR